MIQGNTIMATFVIGLTLVMAAEHSTASDVLTEQMKTGGRVLMIRHAYAPGAGDPGEFKIGDCSTQRNLNDQGRSQARQMGQWLRIRGIEKARVYSSQWCRCLETAENIGLGKIMELPALNSFFEQPQDREPNLAALRTFLARQPLDGILIVLVTHFVTISGITGEAVSSGEGVVLQLVDQGRWKVLGRLDFS